jgi:hypothetical protein
MHTHVFILLTACLFLSSSQLIHANLLHPFEQDILDSMIHRAVNAVNKAVDRDDPVEALQQTSEAFSDLVGYLNILELIPEQQALLINLVNQIREETTLIIQLHRIRIILYMTQQYYGGEHIINLIANLADWSQRITNLIILAENEALRTMDQNSINRVMGFWGLINQPQGRDRFLRRVQEVRTLMLQPSSTFGLAVASHY